LPKVQTVVEIPNVTLERVWEVVCDFERYQESMEDVIEIRVLDREDLESTSSWRVLLNGSELTWTERDYFEPMKRIRFDQVEGDLEMFRGAWELEAVGGGVRVTLNVEFDLGVPSLSQILDPIGVQAIRVNSRAMLEAIRSSSDG
jgi:ribosome-associated toxin RatA of RatAB toxin-antitoxin module